MSNLNGYVITMSMSNPAGEKVAESSIMYEDLEKFRKQTGSHGIMLIEQALSTITSIALTGPNGVEPNKVLPVRKPGQDNFNR